MPKKKEKIIYDNKEFKLLNTGFVKVRNDLIREICIDIGPLAGMIYIILLSHKNSHSTFSYPSIKLLEIETQISHATISTYLKQLEEKEYIKVVRVKDQKTKKSLGNRYFFPRESFYDEKDYQKELEGENNE